MSFEWAGAFATILAHEPDQTVLDAATLQRFYRRMALELTLEECTAMLVAFCGEESCRYVKLWWEGTWILVT